MLRWMKTPQMDEFAAKCAADIIGPTAPDLIFAPPVYVDHQRHRLGVHGDLEHAFRFIDGQMGLVLDALERPAAWRTQILSLLGDHGQLYCDEMFHLNALFHRLGWLQTAEDGSPGRLSGLCRQLFAQRTSISGRRWTRKWCIASCWSNRRSTPNTWSGSFTKEEAAQMHLTGDFDFVLKPATRCALEGP